MKNAIRLQFSTRTGTVARVAVLLVLTMALVVNLAEIFTNSKVVRSSPTESTSPAKTDTHKTGPWHYVVAGTRV